MPADAICVAMFTQWSTPCGIADYTRLLAAALRRQPEIDRISIVEPPDGSTTSTHWAAVRRYRKLRHEYRLRGAQTLGCAADLTHVQHQYFFFGGVAAHKNHVTAFYESARKPIVLTVHEIARPPVDAGRVVNRAIEVVNRANFVHPTLARLIVHTRDDFDRLVEMGVEASKIDHIVHGVPPSMLLPDATLARAHFGLSNRRVITIFGYLARKKGHHVALEALKYLPEDVVLFLAGGKHPDDHTSYVANLEGAIDAAGLKDRVLITGYLPREDVPTALAATNVALAPYLQSSGSGSLSQFFAAGRAVVASDIGPHREIAEDQPSCLTLFPSGNAMQLAAAIDELLNDESVRIALERRTRDYATRHSYDDSARKTVATYKLAMQHI